jgi:hypothetical protein
VPGDERDPAKRRAWAEAEAQKEEAAAKQRETRESGVMGFLRKALGVAEVVGKEVSSLYGVAKGGTAVADNALRHVGYKVAGMDTSALPTTSQAFQEGLASGTYEPRTEEGKEIDQGPVMREIRNAANAVPPARVLSGVKAVQTTKALTSPKGLARIDDAIAQASANAPRAQLAQKALDAGIPLAPHQLTDNGFLKRAGEFAEKAPGAGSKVTLAARKDAFNTGLVQSFFPESKSNRLTYDVFAEGKQKAGAGIDEIAERTPVPKEEFSDLKNLSFGQPRDVRLVVKDYVNQLDTLANEGGGVIDGVALRRLRTEANRLTTSNDSSIAHAGRRIVKKIDDAVSQHAAEADVDALADLRRRYAIALKLEPLVAKHGLTGEIPPAQLKAALTNSKTAKSQIAAGRGGTLGDYADIGQQFLKEAGTSGTAENLTVLKTARDTFYGDVKGVASTVAQIGAARLYNMFGPRIAERMVAKANQEAAALKAARAPGAPQGPAPLELAPEGALPPASRDGAPPGPLGDTVPDWGTAPGARPDGAPLEVAPTEGLVTAVDEAVPMRLPPKTANTSLVGPVRPEAPLEPPVARRGAGSEIPAVPGRPDLPDTMVVGGPAEVAATEAMGATTLAPEAQLAMRTQQTDRNVAAANADRTQPVPAGEATEIKPQVVEPAGTPKVKEPAPEKLPVGEATEVKPQAVEPAKAPGPVDARLTEIERLTAATDSPVVRKALEKRAAAVKKELADEAAATKRREDAAELRRTAALTEDADIKAALFEEAKKIEKADAVPAAKTVEGQPEIKVNKPKELPKPKVVEGQPEIKVKKEEKLPTPETKELGPDGEVLADLDLPKLDEAFMAEQQRAQEPKVDPKLQERGRRQTRAALEKGIADGSIGKDEGELALWALDRNPNLSRGPRLEVSKAADGDNARAVYKSAERVVEIFKNRESDPTRAAHEILHHSERMMPPEVQRGIRREWRRAIDAEMKKATPEVREALGKITEGLNGGRAAFEEMKQAFKDGVLDRETHYHLTNPSEFWAVNATRILSERHAGRNAWRTRAVQWVREMVEHVKSKVGLRSDAPVLKALNEVMDAQKNAGVERSTGTLKTAEVQATLADRLRANKNSTEEK